MCGRSLSQQLRSQTQFRKPILFVLALVVFPFSISISSVSQDAILSLISTVHGFISAGRDGLVKIWSWEYKVRCRFIDA